MARMISVEQNNMKTCIMCTHVVWAAAVALNLSLSIATWLASPSMEA